MAVKKSASSRSKPVVPASDGIAYSPKMLNMWANRYIEISRASGNAEAKAWATKYVPVSQVGALKKLIEDKLRIRRPSDPKAT